MSEIDTIQHDKVGELSFSNVKLPVYVLKEKHNGSFSGKKNTLVIGDGSGGFPAIVSKRKISSIVALYVLNEIEYKINELEKIISEDEAEKNNYKKEYKLLANIENKLINNIGKDIRKKAWSLPDLETSVKIVSFIKENSEFVGFSLDETLSLIVGKELFNNGFVKENLQKLFNIFEKSNKLVSVIGCKKEEKNKNKDVYVNK